MFSWLMPRKQISGVVSDLKNGDKFIYCGDRIYKDTAIVVEPSDVKGNYTHIICRDTTFHLQNTDKVIIFRRAA